MYRSSGLVGRIHVASAGEVLADSLRALMFSGKLETGVLLPTERELAEESGLSRASVREALKILATEGLVSVTVGRSGGYAVQKPPRQAVIRSLDLFIHGQGIKRSSLLEVREVIEPSCAALAADRRDADCLERLDTLTKQMGPMTDDVPGFLELNIDWHIAVADASGNEILASVMTAISTNIRSAISAEEYRSVEHMREAQHLHEGIFNAIREQDSDAAYRRMHRHLTAANEVITNGPTVKLPLPTLSCTSEGRGART